MLEDELWMRQCEKPSPKLPSQFFENRTAETEFLVFECWGQFSSVRFLENRYPTFLPGSIHSTINCSATYCVLLFRFLCLGPPVALLLIGYVTLGHCQLTVRDSFLPTTATTNVSYCFDLRMTTWHILGTSCPSVSAFRRLFILAESAWQGKVSCTSAVDVWRQTVLEYRLILRWKQ